MALSDANFGIIKRDLNSISSPNEDNTTNNNNTPITHENLERKQVLQSALSSTKTGKYMTNVYLRALKISFDFTSFTYDIISGKIQKQIN